MSPSEHGRLFLCGLGPRPAQTASVAALHALSGCAVVVSRAQDRLSALLRDFCPRARHLTAASASAAVAIACGELIRGRDVGLATPGHPLMLGPITPPLLARLAAAASSLEIFGSCSAIGLAMAALQAPMDVESKGLRVYGWRRVAEGRAAGGEGGLLVLFDEGLPDARQRALLITALLRAYPRGASGRLLGPRRADKPVRFGLDAAEAALKKARRESLLYVD